MRGRPWSFDEKVETLFSDCGTHRYFLKCTWDSNKPMVTFILLNPSIASESICDPTVDKCIHFAKRDGYGKVAIVNLFSRISTNPNELLEAVDRTGDKNVKHVNNFIGIAERVVAAWGEEGAWFHMNHKILTLLKGKSIYCLGVNRYGFPRHPGRISKKTQLQELII